MCSWILSWAVVTVTMVMQTNQYSALSSWSYSSPQTGQSADKNVDQEPTVTAVEGGSVSLPCQTRPPNNLRDRVRLVLWFKNQSAIPIYTFDTRDKFTSSGRHWSDSRSLSGRAFFNLQGEVGGALTIDGVMEGDAGRYMCRVDFFKAPTIISEIEVKVIVPPEKPKIFDTSGREVKLNLGPYRIGDSAKIKCETFGGTPAPQVLWWREHALLHGTQESSESGNVINTLLVENLQRENLHSILTCQASNNNISNPVSTSVKIDMHFGPLSVNLLTEEDLVMSAGAHYEVKCQVVGARPPPQVTWWLGPTQIRENLTHHTSPDGNITLSTIIIIPTEKDQGKSLVCRAADAETGDEVLEDNMILRINYVPKALLALGSSLNGSNIKEGDDVYFECGVRANPRPYKITWRRNERPLVHNLRQGIIVSNQSLVLQRVDKQQSGIYTCVAHNSEGDGVSNPITLNVRYTPYCRPEQVHVYGVGRYEEVEIPCDVVSNPAYGISFHWVLNRTSSEETEIEQSVIKVEGTRSLVKYTPRSEKDFGNLLCWGQNNIGVQEEPCVFHIVPAGRPDPVHNCSVSNQTINGMMVVCGGGFDGGLAQTFILSALNTQTQVIVTNLTETRPYFQVGSLLPGHGYVLSVFARNAKGNSEPVTLHAFTMKETEPEHIVADTSRQSGGMVITPALSVLIAMMAGLVLVAVCIILVMRIKHSKGRPQSVPHTRSGCQGTQIPLQSSFSHYSVQDKEPDVIPSNRECIEEEEAFHTYRDHHFATIARRKTDNLDHRDPSFRNNLPRLSEEVTYAELTLPRGKGYSKMLKSTHSPLHANNLYAKTDHSRSMFSELMSSSEDSKNSPSSSPSCFPRRPHHEMKDLLDCGEITSQTPLVGKSQYVVYCSPTHSGDKDWSCSSLLKESKDTRESMV